MTEGPPAKATTAQVSKMRYLRRNEQLTDLGHDNVSNVFVRLTEMDHEANTKHHKRDAEKEGEWLETSSLVDQARNDEGESAGSGAIDVADVGCL